MRLLHGTSTVFQAEIEQHGLLPRTATGHCTYDGQLLSRPYVYLADALPCRYAVKAAERHGGDLLIVEVDVNPARLLLDEDYLARLLPGLQGDDQDRVAAVGGPSEHMHLASPTCHLRCCCNRTAGGQSVGEPYRSLRYITLRV